MAPKLVLANKGLSEIERTRVKRLLMNIMKPVKVKEVVITKDDRYTIRGFVTTVCPVEKVESGKDFEVRLSRNHAVSVTFVSVDGRKLYPKKGQTLQTLE